MTETLQQFENRSYCNFAAKVPTVLVWRTEKEKKAPATTKNRPERWAMEDAKRYANYLKTGELN